MVHVTEIVEITDEIVVALSGLISQLSSSYDTYELDNRDALSSLVAAKDTQLLVARETDTGEILGILTLVLFQLPTGFRARIEDVVVAEHARGRGVGEALVRQGVDRATQAGARSVRLSSRPTREAANRFYTRLGFERRETNVYQLILGE